ncbi:Uma2 family endonuclease [Leptothoe spongobia]|uniref:Uma2 family endonuclease n=1 Tax=Leptothoe spongobia TAU-MAC 1115 TaxID=1967444 RepID=A0A947DJ40_9CYAN|nr:Uma2 family endonuclease [Leptothoe spongobia]MBT9317554.1 Uma2 family endonuclease [Leptothoe spongobia TAU-MAC 1115]
MASANQSVLSPPELENGDHLSRDEFERRYAAMPNLKKAELIEGVVYVPAALRYRKHGKPHSDIMMWLGVYAALTPGLEAADNSTVRLDLDNAPQPDALLRVKTAYGGQSYISEDDYVEGAPELIVEIAGSSAAYDLHEKKTVYRRNGVKEYIVWQVLDCQISWFQLTDGEYQQLSPDEQGLICSSFFPGLDLSVEALLKGDMATVLADVQKGLATAEHSTFVDWLDSQHKPRPS